MENVKTYEGYDKNLIFEQIKGELGESAIILSVDRTPDNVYQVKVGFEEISSVAHNTLSIPIVKTAEESGGVHSYELLLDYGFTPKTAKKIAKDYLTHLNSSQSKFKVADLTKCFRELLKFETEIFFSEKYLQVIGARNSGKTSFSLKLANQLANYCEIKVAIFTVGGSELSEINNHEYIEIISLGFQDVNELRLEALKEKFIDFDLIIIDIPSISDINIEDEEPLRLICESFKEDSETLVMLNSRMSYSFLTKTVSDLNEMNIKGAVISKIDEENSLGSVISVIDEFGLPISFLSTGREIPDDIEPASPERLAWFFLNNCL
jgi:flagellar biosynthesis GTPase FlhF